MQMMQGNASPAASGKWGQGSMEGAHLEGTTIPTGHPCCHAWLGLVPSFLVTETSHHAHGGVHYPLNPLFSLRRAT